MPDLQSLVTGDTHAATQPDRPSTPLHFAAAVPWPEAVEFLVAHGADRFVQDCKGLYPIDFAVRAECVPAMEALLSGDCMTYLVQKQPYQFTTLPPALMLPANIDNVELQEVIVDFLLRYRYQSGILPYHDLARAAGKNNRRFAEKLFAAGLHRIEAYNEEGMTPLMVACRMGNISMISFFLQHGADASRSHRQTNLRAGHFLTYNARFLWTNWDHRPVWRNGLRSEEEEARILRTAFDLSMDVESFCRCSQDGYTPITALYSIYRTEEFHNKKESFKLISRLLNWSAADMKKYWRSLVWIEVFERLELTHTCVRLYPTVKTFPEEDRLEIEDEEEELYSELQNIVDEYDSFQAGFDGNTPDCVEEFFDKLDKYLPPKQFIQYPRRVWSENDPDCLSPGMIPVKNWVSSRGEFRLSGHIERITESHMLRILFD